MGWAYLRQQEDQRTIEPNTLTEKTFPCAAVFFLALTWPEICKGLTLVLSFAFFLLTNFFNDGVAFPIGFLSSSLQNGLSVAKGGGAASGLIDRGLGLSHPVDSTRH
jgi:hypothetical protein